MKRRKSYKKYKLTYIKTTLISLFIGLLFAKGYTPFVRAGENLFHISLNGVEVGCVGSKARAEELLIQARKNIASTRDELLFVETNLECTGEEMLWGTMDDERQVLAAMEDVIAHSLIQTMRRSYTVKVNNFMVNLASLQEVEEMLQAAVNKYDSEGKFQVQFHYDEDREFSVLESEVVNTLHVEDKKTVDYTIAGVERALREVPGADTESTELDFSEYELGIKEMNFDQKVEVVEVYLPESQMTPLSDAIERVTKDQETPSIYKVVSGDTLSEIAIKVNIPMDKIVEMNEALEDERSILRVGQELIITVPEPELSVKRVEQNYYEEIYDADIVYIDNDAWYTTKQVVHQQPSAGFRKVIAEVSFLNDKQISRTILKEEVVKEAVPKIVERGTKIPPTYIKPISGGRLSSSFGKRSAPTKGASTYHKGIDWATPTGTAVYASCGGKVSKAGWGSGYGYVVYIDHADGRQTRYGHLSKVLVTVGQTVKQGEKIALSGNTGVSTGPHIHFEILINGSQVDPLKYIK